MQPSRFVLMLPLLALIAGCATSDPRFSRDTQYFRPPHVETTGRAENRPDPGSYWDGNGITGEPSVKIDLDAQRAYFQKGDTLVGVATVSTGREGYNTPPGEFQITQKNIDHRSNLYGDYVDAAGNVVKRDVDVRKDEKPPGTKFLGAPMPYFLRFNKGIGMHAGYLPGYPASHGCVRLPKTLAQHFFENVEVGTKVTVVN